MSYKYFHLIWVGIYLILGMTRAHCLFAQYPDFEENQITIQGVVEIDRIDENGEILSLYISVITPASIFLNGDIETIEEEYEINEDNTDENTNQENVRSVEIYLIGNSERGDELMNRIGEPVQVTGHVTIDFFGNKIITVDSYRLINE